jgi:hypothetical protein
MLPQSQAAFASLIRGHSAVLHRQKGSEEDEKHYHNKLQRQRKNTEGQPEFSDQYASIFENDLQLRLAPEKSGSGLLASLSLSMYL